MMKMPKFDKKNLEDLMLDNDLSIAELARQTKMQYKIIADYIKELSTPNLYNAIKLASFFNCSLDFITGLSNEENFSKYSTPKFNFFENYQKELKAQNLTNYRLTKDTGIHINDIEKWKTGSIPTLYNLIKIADYLGVSIDSLIGREKIKE